jgi:hypothetical protein
VPGLLALTLLVAACATAKPPPLVPRTSPAPAPGDILAALRARQDAVRAVNLETRVKGRLGNERARATVLVLADRAGRLRFEAEAPLQGAVASLAVDGSRFSFLDVRERIYRHGPACPENVAALIRIPLAPAEIAAVLLGDAPIAPDARAVAVDWDGRLAADILVLDREAPRTGGREGGIDRLWVTCKRHLTTGRWDVLAVAGGSPAAPFAARWRVVYEELEPVGAHMMPALVRFAEPGKSFDEGVEIAVKDRVVNPSLAAGAFTLAPPAGYQVELMPCGAGPGR